MKFDVTNGEICECHRQLDKIMELPINKIDQFRHNIQDLLIRMTNDRNAAIEYAAKFSVTLTVTDAAEH